MTIEQQMSNSNQLLSQSGRQSQIESHSSIIEDSLQFQPYSSIKYPRLKHEKSINTVAESDTVKTGL